MPNAERISDYLTVCRPSEAKGRPSDFQITIENEEDNPALY